MHNDGAKRGTALSGGAETREQRALDCKIKIGTRRDNQWILPAQLQTCGLKVAASQCANLPANRRRAGESDLLYHASLERLLESGEGSGPIGMDDVENSVGKSAAPYEELMECRAAGCGVFGGFPDDRIARQEGRHDVPGGHRD